MPAADPPAPTRLPNAPAVKAADERGRPALRRPFVVSIAVALALNGILLAALASSAQHWRVSTHPQRRVTWVTAVAAVPAVPAVETAGTPAPAEPAPVGAPSLSRAVAPSPEPAPAPAAPREAASAAAAPTQPVARDEANDVRFYAYREVDQPAEPDSDWNLDAAVLDGAGIKLLVFEVFISATGEIVACTILRPAELPADTRSLLEDRLRHTALRPATRAGAAVPSVRRIELSVQ